MKFSSILFAVISLFCLQSTQADFATFYEWKKACNTLPRYNKYTDNPRDGYTGSMFIYGKNETHALLKKWSSSTHKIRAIFRAHQHSGKEICDRFFNRDNLGHSKDKGVAKLWIENNCHHDCLALLDNIAVVTFSVAPEAGYGWPFHSFGELHVKPAYKDWRLL